jgi:hypothetical protein
MAKGKKLDEWGSCTKNLGQWGPAHNEWKWDGETDGPWDYVLQSVPVDEQKHRDLPNSDPAQDSDGENFSYQPQPWEEEGETRPGNERQYVQNSREGNYRDGKNKGD